MKYVPLFFFSFCKAEEEECFNKENLPISLSYDMAAKKRKKDQMNNNTKVPCESQRKGPYCLSNCFKDFVIYVWGKKSRNIIIIYQKH